MALPEFEIVGNKALVVRAGRGIGRWIALVLAEAGADVAVVSLTPGGVDQVVGEIRQMGRRSVGLTADATKAAEMDRAARQALGEFGSIDTLVNCVGDSIRKPLVAPPDGGAEGMTEADWHFVVDVNLTEAFQGCRALGSHLLQQRHGSVINISGIMGFRGQAHLTAYSAAKGALTQFTQALAKEWAPYGVRVNAVAPGSFPDPDQISQEAYEAGQREAEHNVPLGRLGGWRDVGLLVVYLASEASSYVPGQCWAVDGGQSIAGP